MWLLDCGTQDPLGVQAIKLVDNTTMGNMTVKECTGVAASTCHARTVTMYPVGDTSHGRWSRSDVA